MKYRLSLMLVISLTLTQGQDLVDNENTEGKHDPYNSHYNYNGRHYPNNHRTIRKTKTGPQMTSDPGQVTIHQPFGLAVHNLEEPETKENSTKVPPSSQMMQGCVCGTAPASRVVNGENTTIVSYPWTAQLTLIGDLNTICEGLVISTRHILTTAHCIENEDPNKLLIRLGLTRTRFSDEGYRVEALRIHPRYLSFDDYDIGIVVTREEIIFSQRIQPVCLPGPRQTFDKQRPAFPGIYTSVDKDVRQWIASKTANEGLFCPRKPL